MEQKIRAAVSLFHYTLINGDSTTQTESFDGLDKMLAGTTTEFNTSTVIDVSDLTKMKSNADQLYEMLQILIRETGADALLMNAGMISKVQTMARILGYKTETEEAFGKKVTSMDGVRFMDLKDHYTVESGTTVIVHGKNGVDFYKTNGKRGTRALFNAFNSMKPEIVNDAKIDFKDLGE